MKIYISIVLSLFFSAVTMANSYGVELSDEEKITALTNYFIKEDMKMKKLSLPPQPIKPVVQEAKPITKSKYEKIKTYENRVKIEKENYLKRVKNTESIYQQSLKEYELNVQKITNNYNSKNRAREKIIKHHAKEKAYATVYGNPYILKSSLEYDAENELFNAKLKSTKGDFFKNIVINVPINEAEGFEKYIIKMKIKVAFDLKYNDQKLKYITIKSSKNTYIAKLK